MKRLIKVLLLCAALAYFGLLPFSGADIRGLLPVRTVLVTREGTQYEVDVGAGVRGVGRTLQEALDTLKERVNGTLFFQTANQVVVREDAADCLPEAAASTAFRPGATVYLTRGTPDPAAAADWLEDRDGGLTLARYRALTGVGRTPTLPLLVQAGGGFELYSPAEE